MKFLRATGSYINCFYFLGHCLYPLKRLLNFECSDEKSKSCLRHLQSVIPLVYTNALNFGLCGLAILWIHTRGNMDQSTKTLTFLFALCQVLRALAILYQTVFHSNHICEIVQIFRWTEFYFRNDLTSTLSYKLFRKRLRIKLTVVFFSCTQTIIFYSLQQNVDFYVKWIGLITRFLLVLSMPSIFHIVFYADLLTFNLHHLNSIIARDTELYSKRTMCTITQANRQLNGRLMHDNLRKYKFVHYRLWQASQMINEHFGWSLIALMLQCFIDIVFSLYWEIRVLYMTFAIETFEPLSTFLFVAGNTILLINACYYCICERDELIKNVEELMFWASDYYPLYNAKQEILSQFTRLEIGIGAKGFFYVHRSFLGAMVSAGCTYVVIFLQFDMSKGEN